MLIYVKLAMARSEESGPRLCLALGSAQLTKKMRNRLWRMQLLCLLAWLLITETSSALCRIKGSESCHSVRLVMTCWAEQRFRGSVVWPGLPPGITATKTRQPSTSSPRKQSINNPTLAWPINLRFFRSQLTLDTRCRGAS